MSSDDYCYSTSTNQRRVKVDNPRIIFISSRVPAAEVNTIESYLMSLFLHRVYFVPSIQLHITNPNPSTDSFCSVQGVLCGY